MLLQFLSVRILFPVLLMASAFTGYAHAQNTDVTAALSLVEEGRVDEAISLLRKSLSSYSGEQAALIRYELGRTETDPALASTELGRAAVQSSSRRAAAQLALGELLILTDRGAEAFDQLRDVVSAKQGALSERASYLKGVALYHAGRYTDARNAFADCLVDYLEGTWQISSRIGIAQCNEAIGERRLAIEIYKAVSSQHRGFDEEPWILAHLANLLKPDAPPSRREATGRASREGEPAGRDAAGREADKYLVRLRTEYPEYIGEDGVSSQPSQASQHIIAAATAIPAPSPTPVPVAPRPRQDTTSARQGNQGNQRTQGNQSNMPGPTSGSAAAPVMSRGRFTLQVGAFRSREAAENLSADLSRKGFPAEIIQRGELHVVRAGRYPNQADAIAARPALEQIVKARIIIVER